MSMLKKALCGENIYTPRALYLNGDWETFQHYRIERQCQTLYPYKEQVDAIWHKVKDKAAERPTGCTRGLCQSHISDKNVSRLRRLAVSPNK